MAVLRTVEYIGEQLENLATLTDIELNKASVNELRKQLSLLGVNTIERNGKAVEVYRARKQELLLALQTLVNKQRALNTAIIPSETEVVPSVQEIDAVSVYNRLEALVNEPFTTIEREITAIAHDAVMAIARAYPDTEEQPRFNTRCNVRGKLRRDVLELVLDRDVAGVRTVFELWSNDLIRFTSADSNLKRKTNDAKTEAKAAATEAGDTVGVKIEPLLIWATSVLKKASDGKLMKGAWKDVAISLGLVTGRRMYSEVLYELTTFEATGSHQISVHELAKSTDDDEVTELHELTTLCDAALVVAGKQWLVDNRKVQPVTEPTTQFTKVADRTKSNQKYGSDLSKHWRGIAEAFGIPEGATTVHTLRKLYVMKAIEGVEGYRSRGKEAARLLGHRSWQTAQDNYNSGFSFVS